MRVGILGSGLMGGKLGTIFARARHEVTFSYARSSASADAIARLSYPTHHYRKAGRLALGARNRQN